MIAELWYFFPPNVHTDRKGGERGVREKKVIREKQDWRLISISIWRMIRRLLFPVFMALVPENMLYPCLYTVIEYSVPWLCLFYHGQVFYTLWLTALHRLSSVAIVLRLTSSYKGSGDFCLEPPGSLSSICHSPHSSSSSHPLTNGNEWKTSQRNICLFLFLKLWLCDSLALILSCVLLWAPRTKLEPFLHFPPLPPVSFCIPPPVSLMNHPCAPVLT